MSVARRFDWDEARRLRAEGLTYEAIARRLGVTGQAIRFACDDAARARAAEACAAWMKNGVCVDCGGRANRHSKAQITRCVRCTAAARVKVRGGEAFCGHCDQWKPLEDFRADGRRPLRGVAARCRACETAARQERRQRVAA